MEAIILEAIERFSLFESGSTVTVALSGGADSMSLLYASLSLKKKLGIEVNAAHLNHMIRGEEALRDENFVKEQCENAGVKLFCERADVPAFAKKNGLSIELAAREVRYEFLRRVSSGVVATAHTASDNLETMIFNLSRGTAIDGLCGIPPKRDIFVRPLLLCSREDVEKYCAENNIPYVTDSTNLTEDYARNKIRHNIIPVLKELNPNIENTALRTAVSLKEDAKVLNSLAENYLESNVTAEKKLNLKGFENLQNAVAKRVIIKYIDGLGKGISLENVHIEAVYSIAVCGGKTSLPKNYSAVVKNGLLSIMCNGAEMQVKTEFLVDVTEENDLFLKNIQNVNNLLLKNLLDRDKIVGKWKLRTRIAGDSIRIKNRGCTKTLNKLFTENGVPVELRDNIPVIADEKGVIWVYGLGVAQRCAVGQNTKRLYKIEVIEKQGF